MQYKNNTSLSEMLNKTEVDADEDDDNINDNDDDSTSDLKYLVSIFPDFQTKRTWPTGNI